MYKVVLYVPKFFRTLFYIQDNDQNESVESFY